MDRQRVWLFVWAMLMIFCVFIWRRERPARIAAAEDLRQSVYSTPMRTILRAVLGYLAKISLSWLILLFVAGSLLCCAAWLELSADALPRQLFSVQSWMEFFRAKAMAAQRERSMLMPLVQRARLIHELILISGTAGVLAVGHICLISRGRENGKGH